MLHESGVCGIDDKEQASGLVSPGLPLKDG